MTQLIHDFVDLSGEWLKENDLRRMPGKIAEEMIDESFEKKDDWKGWKLIPSTVTQSDLQRIERTHNVELPKSYKDLLQYKHFYDLACFGFRFTPNPIDLWTEEIQRALNGYMPERIIKRGYIPFGHESFMDAGPVCFDATNKEANDDYPIVFWDHEWINTEKEISLMFSSTSKMFECMIFALKQDNNFFYSDEDDSTEVKTLKKETMKQFLSIDPTGAGAIGKDYWTSWGVKP
jgi:hypothetical protein